MKSLNTILSEFIDYICVDLDEGGGDTYYIRQQYGYVKDDDNRIELIDKFIKEVGD